MNTEENNRTHLDYSAAPESAVHAEIKKQYSNFIAGKFIKPTSGKYAAAINPATGQKLSETPDSGAKDVNAAVVSASQTWTKWKKVSGRDRGKYLFRIARMIQERAKELAIVETLDGGKPIRESRDFDIPLAAAHFFYYAGWADKLQYAFPNKTPSPIGVCAQIIPWNFPLLMAAWKIAPALATGNTVVIKPAESTALSALKLAEIIRDADLPPGVVNIICGGGKAGELLCMHNKVQKIAFTGSTEVGKRLQKLSAGSGRKISLELGGKAAHIIFADAAINQAVEGVVNGIFFNQGHVCCAGSRLLVQENIAEEVISKLKRRMSTLIVGDPMDKNTDIGAVNNEIQHKKIHSYLKIGQEEGLEMYQPDDTLPATGYFCLPTLFIGAAQSSRVVQEEIFGPVLTIQTFRTEEEAIEKANNTPFGLSAGVWSEKSSRILNLTSRLRAGVVWANTYNKFDPASPFGGFKESGFGREGGLHGLQPYLTW